VITVWPPEWDEKILVVGGTTMGGDTTMGGWGTPGLTGTEGSVGSAVTVCGLKTRISSTYRTPRCEPAIRSQLFLLLMVLTFETGGGGLP
jgi:hypothetical protein